MWVYPEALQAKDGYTPAQKGVRIMDKQDHSPALAQLRARMIACGKSQQEIADSAGVGQTTVSRIMRGAAYMPGLDVAERINDYLNSLEPKKPGRRAKGHGLLLPVVDMARINRVPA